ncbi:MAG: hypothetical protein GQ531_11395 [Sulfurovum sp.]|nr:hypothetical protein [Sulfurovum sp.]
MNKIIIVSILVSSLLMGIEAKKSAPQKISPVNKAKVQGKINAKSLSHDNYYTNVTSNCEKYIDIISQKDQEIEALKKELHSIKSKEHAIMQKKLQKEHAQELKEFDNRKADKTTKSRAIISDKPID